MVVDAKHRPLVSSYKFFVHVRHPAYRPGGESGRAVSIRHQQRKLTRSREAGDVNAEVREAVDRDGYSLFRIGLSLAEIPKS